MSNQAEVIVTLQDLGLTRTEAEVYVAVLQESGHTPISGYKIAQSMGRDPANLSKTLSALAKQGAVRVIQEKPRLFLAVDPKEFTTMRVQKIKSSSDQALSLLQAFKPTPGKGLPLALQAPAQAIEQAITLLSAHPDHVLVFGTHPTIQALSPALGQLPATANVRVLCPEDIDVPGADITVMSGLGTLELPETSRWLQLVTNKQTWLIADLGEDRSADAPCGWWCEDPGLARVMAVALEAAAIPGLAPVQTMVSHNQDAKPAVEPTPEPPVQPKATSQQAPVDPEEKDDDKAEVFEEGLSFIVRHEENE